MKTSLKILATFAICAALTTGTTFARNDHDSGKPGDSHHRVVRDRDRDHDRDRDRRERRERREARERAWRRDHRQNGMFGTSNQPYGWTQGRKTGWSNCDVPPGQAKKVGCTPSTRNHTRHSRNSRRWSNRDRDHDGDRD